MRVISGKLKGRTIEGYDILGTRPTMDRVKEAIFSMIRPHLKDSVCLDLFCGSGSLGIEAVSNGAFLCYFVDNNKEAIKVVNKTISKFDISNNSVVINSDYLSFLENAPSKFDVIFLDPPYDKSYLNGILEYISTSTILKKDGIIVVEYTKEKLKNNYNDLFLYTTRRYGIASVSLYKMDKMQT